MSTASLAHAQRVPLALPVFAGDVAQLDAAGAVALGKLEVLSRFPVDQVRRYAAQEAAAHGATHFLADGSVRAVHSYLCFAVVDESRLPPELRTSEAQTRLSQASLAQ